MFGSRVFLMRKFLPSPHKTPICRDISKCVYIKGLPAHTAEFQIKNALQEYGNIEYIKVFNTSGYKNSNCLVGFSDVDSAISVVDELDQRVMIYNYRVTVTYSSRRYYGYNKAYAYQKRNTERGGASASASASASARGGDGHGHGSNSAVYHRRNEVSSSNSNNNIHYNKSHSQAT